MKLRIFLKINLTVFLTILKQTYSILDNSQCNSTSVISETVVYNGCQESISLENLGNNSAHVTIHTFKGIPYAKPPIKTLRFAKPECYVHTSNESIDATKFKSSCIQAPLLSAQPGDTTDQNEDCLYLNIWTPTIDRTANLPVMFYIPGGAFQLGSGRNAIGSILASRQFVVINVNYRLGAFGFLCGDQPDAPGNQGLWDQIEALNWTRNHIRDFGGNPNNITAFGQSAGAMSLSYLVLSDVSKNMFQKAILQSGSGMHKLYSNDKASATKMAKRFAANSTLFLHPCPCNNTDVNWITCMRNKTADEILLAQLTAAQWNFGAKPWFSGYLLEFAPIYGDDLMPDTLNKSIAAGQFRTEMPLLIGHTEMEGEYFARIFDILRALLLIYQGNLNDTIGNSLLITKDKVYNDIKNTFIDEPTFGALVADKYTENFDDTNLLPNLIPNLISNLIAILKPNFNQNSIIRNRLRGSAVHALGDFTLTCPTILFGHYLAKIGVNVYQYRLTYINKKSACYQSDWCNATHSDDNDLVFGLPFLIPNDYTDDDKLASKLIMDIWTQFARNGTVPQVNGYDWPPYSVVNGTTNLKYMVLDIDPNKAKVVENGYDGEFTPSCINNCKNFWDPILYGMF